MTDTSGMVPSIESDRIGGPRVELWGDWLQRIYVPERTLPLPFGDVSDVDHVHYFHLGGKLLLAPGVRLTGLTIVLTLRSLFLVLGV